MSDDPIRKYVPAAADILRRSDEEAAERELQDALNNPDLDRVLAEAHKRAGGEAPPLEAPVRTGGAGPWHEAPQGAPPAPHGTRGGEAHPRRARTKRRIPGAVSILLAAMAVTAPAVLVAFLKPGARYDTPPQPAAAEASMQDASVEQPQASAVPEGGQTSAPEGAQHANPEGQTPEPAASSSAPAPAVEAPAAGGSRAPRAPYSAAPSPKPTGTRDAAPDPEIPEGYFQ